MTIEKQFLENVHKELHSMKKLADRTFVQLNNEELHWHPASESNSIAIIVKHLSGNLISRWTDFLTTDGEKPWRNRDDEFEEGFQTKEDLIAVWNKGWEAAFTNLEKLTEADLLKTITIRGEAHTVLQAIHRQLIHSSNHIGQIIYIGKQIKNEQFSNLTIPKGQSGQFLTDKLNELKNK